MKSEIRTCSECGSQCAVDVKSYWEMVIELLDSYRVKDFELIYPTKDELESKYGRFHPEDNYEIEIKIEQNIFREGEEYGGGIMKWCETPQGWGQYSWNFTPERRLRG